MRVVIAGCGDLGTEVGLQLAAAGHQVVGIRRSPARLPAPIIGVRGELSVPGRIEELPDDTAAVVYAAAPDARSEAAYLGTYLAGPGHVLDALARVRARPRRFVFVSSTAVYGVDDGSWVDEDTPTAPADVTGEVLVAAEVAVLERAPTPTVVRLSGIYGPGRTRLVDQVRDGRAVVPDPPVYSNRIHRDDAAAAIVHLLKRDEEPAACYLGSDDAPVERGEVLRWLADELRVPPPPTGPDQRSRGGNKRCRNDRLAATGFAFTYPTYREGYAAVLRGEGVRHP
jgi:nucleoside-diphosphate-sugar epimerase